MAELRLAPGIRILTDGRSAPLQTVRAGTHALVLQAERDGCRVALKLPRLIHKRSDSNQLAVAAMGDEVERLVKFWKTNLGADGLAPFLGPAMLERSSPGVASLLTHLFGPLDLLFVERIPAAIFGWMDGSIADPPAESASRDWTAREYLLLAHTLATGLAALHEHGALHGDVRPNNVMFAGDSSDPGAYLLTEYSAERPSEPSSVIRTERRRRGALFPPEARYAPDSGLCRLHKISAATAAEADLFVADADAPPTADELEEAGAKLEQRAGAGEPGPRLSLELRNRLIEISHAVSLPQGVAVRCHSTFRRRIPPHYAIVDEAAALGATIHGRARWRMKRSERGDLYGLGASLLHMLKRSRPAWRRDPAFARLTHVIARCMAAGSLESGQGRWAVPAYRDNPISGAAEVVELCSPADPNAMEAARSGCENALPAP